MSERKSIPLGTKFTRLTVIGVGKPHKTGASTTIFKCDCGTVVTLPNSRVKIGKARSCGCLKNDLSRARLMTHGHSRTNNRSREYEAWRNMLSRCEYVGYKSYKDYGGRGITVCPQWHDFETFFKDVGPIPKGLSIDRIDTNGNYEPGNVRLATRLEQNNNRRDTPIRSVLGKTGTLKQLARQMNMNYNMVWKRVNQGWSVEKALTEPATPRELRRTPVADRGQLPL